MKKNLFDSKTILNSKKNLLVFFMCCALFSLTNCKKSLLDDSESTNLLTAKVLAHGCGNDRAVVIQLYSENSLAVDWKKPGTDSVFHNVLFTISYPLSRSVGKNFSYTNIRTHTSQDSLWITTANCFDNAYYVFDGIVIN